MVNELRSPKSSNRWIVGAFVAAASCAGFLLDAGEACAQEAADTGQVTGTAKGIVGGGLLGAEVVMIPMGAAGLKPWWPYVVFGSVGAVGGAIGGWAVEQAGPPAEAPLYMLAGGLALVIPTLVLTLNATTRESFPESQDPATLTTTPTDTSTPPAAPAGPDGQPPPAEDGTKTIKIQSDARKHFRRVPRAPFPTSLFDLAGNELRMGVPAFQVRNLYSNDEMAKFGVGQGTEVRVPVFGVAF